MIFRWHPAFIPFILSQCSNVAERCYDHTNLASAGHAGTYLAVS
jgi:hypothetical protein